MHAMDRSKTNDASLLGMENNGVYNILCIVIGAQEIWGCVYHSMGL